MKVGLSRPVRATSDQESSSTHSFWERLSAFVIFTTAAILPLFIALGADSFRVPKEALFRAEAIILLTLMVTTAIGGGWRELAASLRMPAPFGALIAALATWSALAALLSTNRTISLYALEYTATSLVVFAATYAVARTRTVEWIAAPVAIAAIPNAVLALLQASSVWNPIRFDRPQSARLGTTALIGNPNDVGSYLMIATVLLMTAAIATRRRRWWLVAALSGAGVVASGALTAMIALFAAALTAVVIASRRRILTGTALITLVLVSAVVLPPLRSRAASLLSSIQNRDYASFTSQRVYGIGTAWAMFLDHPWTGVGPGAFKFNYLPYRKEFDERHPNFYLAHSAVENFAEVHCDHAQILAEEGLPGYVIFLMGLLAVGSISFRISNSDRDSRSRFARAGGVTLATGFAVLALAAFPLEIAASTQVLLHGTAAMIRWSNE